MNLEVNMKDKTMAIALCIFFFIGGVFTFYLGCQYQKHINEKLIWRLQEGDNFVQKANSSSDEIRWEGIDMNLTITEIGRDYYKKEGCTNCLIFPQAEQYGKVEWDKNIEAWYMNGISIEFCPWCWTNLKKN